MRQAAEALDRVFVYALIPRAGLAEFVRDRAAILARKRPERVSHSMFLKDQQISAGEQKKAFEPEVEKLVRNMPEEPWDEHHHH